MDFNDLFILECFKYKEDREFLNMFTIPSMKDFTLSTRYQFLKKNEYIVEDPNDTTKMILSVKGQDLLLELKVNTDPVEISPGMTAQVVLVDFSASPDEQFEEWWKHYPTSPAWKSDDGNTVFAGSRTLKNLRKAEAKKRYLKLLNQGLKHEELLGSLLFEIKLKKLDSIKKNQNQMEYFKGMESYLNQERYLLFIDSYRDNPTWVSKTTSIKGKKQNVTDI
jgi:hypothetical protein